MSKFANSHLAKVGHRICFHSQLSTNNTCRNGLIKNSRSISSSQNNKKAIDKLFIFNKQNMKTAYSQENLVDLIKSYGLLKISSSEIILNNYEKLLISFKTILGEQLFNFLVRKTIYSQFIAGEDEKSVNERLKYLSTKDIGGIIDYAVESDLPRETKLINNQKHSSDIKLNLSNSNKTLDFEINNYLDYFKKFKSTLPDNTSFKDDEIALVNRFVKSIEIASSIESKPGFVALKLTSMCDTVCLQKINQYFLLLRALFDEKKNQEKNYIEKNNFFEAISFLTSGKVSQVDCDKIYETSCLENVDRKLYFYDFAQILFPTAENKLVSMIVSQSKTASDINLINNNIKEFESLYKKLDYISSKAADKKIKLMVDAEQTYFQDSIHITTILLQKKYNKNSTIIFNTYQSYLKKTFKILEDDLNYRNNCVEKFLLAVKLVRGAYDIKEREIAHKDNLPNPVCDTYEDTNTSFNRCADLLIENVSKNFAAISVASHNSDSISMIVNRMKNFDIHPKNSNISFAQLLGMSDYITYILAKNNYNVYKYMPYGPVNEVLPYLARRISENRSVLKRVQVETDMIFLEICKKVGIPENLYSPDIRKNKNINSE